METERPIEIVSWTNEEGARFTPAMLGSAVFTGVTPLGDALAKRDSQGICLADALADVLADTLDASGYGDYGSTRAATGMPVDSYFEAHIEQGPVLEANGTRVGVVTGGQAIRWLDVTVTGVAAHAGTTPMPYRKDACFASAQMASELERMVERYAPRGLATIGQMEVANGSRNTIAAKVSFTVDLRHPDDAQLDAMERDLRAAFARIAQHRGVQVEIATYWTSPATPFDASCVEQVAEAAEALGYSNERIVSGAGHDAIHLARYCPTAMVFIPCVGGLSHNEAEDALPEDVTCGANVLLNAVLARAGTSVGAAVR